jgi:hypothetical protein
MESNIKETFLKNPELVSKPVENEWHLPGH